MDAKNDHFGKEKREKKKAVITAEMTNENGGKNDRLEVRNECYSCWIFFFFFSEKCTIVLVEIS
ncbi:hypothetical protein [Flavobacterium cellulosilyticum]|uniref:Uncharacterized protein n=1 Tax=Flavobacterium cellulosilyticum TaxID=2541731 RepID=A0A4R5CHZ6_9FLAO|nr:hypothetical protein [Flavobacterium cellulosilyticum]TDD97923.1 hypothetical protein E0F76_07425 [Flavobacterium cellulosilyticum]